MKDRGVPRRCLPSGAAALGFATASWQLLLPSLQSQPQVLGSFVSKSWSSVQTMVCTFQEPAFAKSFPLSLGLAAPQKQNYCEAEDLKQGYLGQAPQSSKFLPVAYPGGF